MEIWKYNNSLIRLLNVIGLRRTQIVGRENGETHHI
jgi:hypothetical protein